VELSLLTITIHADLPAGFLPVLDDRRGRVDDCAVHVEEQSGEVDDFGRGGKVVFFVVRHVERELDRRIGFLFVPFAFLGVRCLCRFLWFFLRDQMDGGVVGVGEGPICFLCESDREVSSRRVSDVCVRRYCEKLK
jgi:hypothetical protein